MLQTISKFQFIELMKRHRITHVIARALCARGDLSFISKLFVNMRLPRRYAPRNDIGKTELLDKLEFE